MNFIDKMVERFNRLNRRLKRWRRGVSVLAAIVVFATTYALVLPAVTLDKETASTQAGMEIAAEQIEPEETGTVYESEPEETDSGSESEPAESEDADAAGYEDEEDSGSDSGSAAAEEEATEEESAASNEENDAAIDEEDVAAPADNSEAEGSTEEEPSEEPDEQSSGSMTAEIAAEGATDLIAEEMPLITEQTQLFYENRDENNEVDYVVYAEFGEAAKLPVGVELQVKEITKERDPEAYEMYSRKALEEMKDRYDENTALSFARFYDISFVYNGAEVEPGGDVKVRIEYAKTVDIRQETSVDAIHFDKEDQEKVDVIRSEIDSEKKGKEESVKAVEFASDRFSVYGIVGTEVLTGDVITADGSTYTVTVRYAADARIPSGAELKVSEITEESEEYAQYAEEAARTIYGADKSDDTAPVLPYVRFFDISILDGESEIEPAAPVQVEIALKDGAIDEMENGAAFSTVHFTENGAEKMTIDVADSVKFETDSFSVYGVAYTYTVDFYYEQAEYHLDGGNEMLLSALFAELGIERNADEAQEVIFSTPSLVRVEKKDGQWNLVSLMPFLSAETLTVTFPDGEVIVIYVTDATTWTAFGTNCEWRLVNGVLEIRAKAANATLPIANGANGWPWNADRSSITSARFVQNSSNSWKVNAARNMGCMFDNCPNLQSVDFSYLNTATCTGSMWGLFRGDSSLTSITWGDSFNTSNVTAMHQMFQNCSSLTSLDLSHFDTQNVTNMTSMFRSMSGLTELNLPNFVTPNLEQAQYIFQGCTNLRKLDISNFDVRKVYTAGHAFLGLSSIEEFKLGDNFRWSCGPGGIIDQVDDQYKASAQPPRGTWIFEPADGSGAVLLTDAKIYENTKSTDQKVAGTYKLYSRDSIHVDVATTFVVDYNGADWYIEDSTGNYKMEGGHLWAKMPKDQIDRYPSDGEGDVTIDGVYKGTDITVPGSITVIYKNVVHSVEDPQITYNMRMTFSDIELFNMLLIKDGREIEGDMWFPFYGVRGLSVYDYETFNSLNRDYNDFYRTLSEKINIKQTVVDAQGNTIEGGTYIFGAVDLDLQRTIRVHNDNSLNDLINDYGRDALSEGNILVDGYYSETLKAGPGLEVTTTGSSTYIFSTHIDGSTSFEEYLVAVKSDGFQYVVVQPHGSASALEPGGQSQPITLKKVDEWDTEKPVAEASLRVYDMSSTSYGTGEIKLDIIANTEREWTTSEQKPDYTFYPVANKYFIYEETNAPSGYGLAAPILFYVDASFKVHVIKEYDSTTVPGSYIISDTAYLTPPDEDGQNGIVRMVDPRIKGELKIKKQVSYNNEEPETAEQKSKLAGTYVFTIYTDEECTVPYQKTEGEDVTISITIGEDGAPVTSEAVELAPGQYWVKENEPENDAYPLLEVQEFNIVGGETAESAVIMTFTNNITEGEDKPYIIVTKQFVGITKDQIPEDFRITVTDGTHTYELTKGMETTHIVWYESADGLLWTWKIFDVTPGTHYTVSEENEEVTGYTVTTTGTGGDQTIKPADISYSVLEIEHTCSHTKWTVNDDTLFAASTTNASGGKGTLIVSRYRLSVSERKAVEEKLLSLLRQHDSNVWKTPVRYYSIEDNPDGFVINATRVVYDYEHHQIELGATDVWQHVASVGFEKTDPVSGDFHVTNTYVSKTVDIHVLKVDDSTPGKPLTGASFKLTQVDESGHAVPGGIEQGPKDVDENGKLDFEGLVIGLYELEETKTPDGYVKTSDNPRFEVKADSETGELGIVFTDTDTVKYASDTKTFTVINKPGAQLPATGGPGTQLYTLGGLALMLGAALMYGFSMRRRERRSN